MIDPPAWWFALVDWICLIAGVAAYMQDAPGSWGQIMGAVTAALSLIFILTRSSRRLYLWAFSKLRLHLIAASLRA